MDQPPPWSDESGPWPAPATPGWRAHVKRWLVRAAAAGRSAADPSDGVAILAYHGSEPDRSHPWWLDFHGQMALLEDLGYEVVSLAAAVGVIRSGPLGTRPRAAITFDDGWANNLEVAFPELARRRWPASVFLTTSFLGRRPFLHAGEVKSLVDLGVAAEMHTDSHPDLTTIDDLAIASEVTRCRARIEELTGRTPEFFCYPFGRVDRRVRDAVAGAGAEAACTGAPGRNRPGEDPFLLRRVTIDPGDGPAELKAGLAGGNERMRRLLRLRR